MSVGLYTHISKAAGVIVDAPLYNNAHQNHLTNDIPTSAGANSDTVVQYQTTLDPAPADVPAIVISIALELEQLRFVLMDINTGINLGVPPAFWYTPVTTPTTATIKSYGAAVSKLTTPVTFNTLTPVSFNTTEYDTNGPNGSPFFAIGSPTIFTAPVRGIYYLHGTGAWAGAGAFAKFFIAIRRNGGQLLAIMEGFNDVVQAPMSVGCEYQLEAGDTVDFVLFQSLDFASPIGFNDAQFRIQWLGGAAS